MVLLNKDLEEESNHQSSCATSTAAIGFRRDGSVVRLFGHCACDFITVVLSWKSTTEPGKPAEALEQALVRHLQYTIERYDNSIHVRILTLRAVLLGNGVKNIEVELDVVQSDYTDRTHGLQAKLEDYYNRVIILLADKDAYEQVIFVARLALIHLLTVRGFVREGGYFSHLLDRV